MMAVLATGDLRSGNRPLVNKEPFWERLYFASTAGVEAK
jgi:hypothetical protein